MNLVIQNGLIFLDQEMDFFYTNYCRKRNLCDNGYLRYKYLYNFDILMKRLDEVFNFITSPF